jgi:NAD(P)-dependent dehydrogenase (short-subunit alcohol dehydrogenase family)
MTGGIDAVVANAGITDTAREIELPQGLDAEAPPKPNFATLEVNLLGALYTTHLAMFWLPRNPNSKNASVSSNPITHAPDRHLLLIGSL